MTTRMILMMARREHSKERLLRTMTVMIVTMSLFMSWLPHGCYSVVTDDILFVRIILKKPLNIGREAGTRPP